MTDSPDQAPDEDRSGTVEENADNARKRPPKEVRVKLTADVMKTATLTDNDDLQKIRLVQLAETLWLSEDTTPQLRTNKFNDIIQTLVDFAPRDEFERLLAHQLIACHNAAMECYRRAMLPNQTFEGRNSALKHAARMSAMYAKLLETLNKHRGKGQQKVTVEHVHVAAGGQAIVGNVEAGDSRPAPAPEKVPAPAPAALEHQPAVPMQPVTSKPKTRRRG